ncbi:type II secretion system F family protein [Comamonas terrigena]|uniref:type II secretion system F family protein n=1 Tax=Comamonas terrigena TaxID=32013 RepID=UPI0028999A66|nr:type II secretion system F family protein [Comamonas terrigena]
MDRYLPGEGSVLAALALLPLLVLGWWLWRLARQRAQRHRHVDAVLQRRQPVGPIPRSRTALRPRQWLQRQSQRLRAWLASPAGQQVVAQEDRTLLAQCGFGNSLGVVYLVLARLALVAFLPLLLALWAPAFMARLSWLYLFAALALGYLLPKWVLRRYAQRRRRSVEAELPVLVDLLSLLQGSGQGIDQSLQLIAQDFGQVLPVLSRELQLANRLYAGGRSRDQAFSRLSEMFHSDSLADLTALLVQIDQHGGAVQEPLRQFGQRLREQRRMRMKEAIGKVTVKMTAVMVLTLLPALMVITAGPGFLAVMRTLGSVK